MIDTVIEALGRLERKQEPGVIELADNATGLDLLQTVYSDPKQPLGVRLRSAIEALPFENPKLSAVAVTNMSGRDFADRLDRAIERSASARPRVPLMIEHKPTEQR